MGTTIWSLHFIAMMAVEFPVLINYNIVETLLSICFAIFGTAAGLYIVSKNKMGRFSIVGGGVAMGLAIGSMHYTGMSAIRGCGLSYDPDSGRRRRWRSRSAHRWRRYGLPSTSARSG